MFDFLDLPTHRLHYRVDGLAHAPVLVFSNSLGTNLHMWDEQIEELSKRYRLIRYDRRGHGSSTVSNSAFTIADLGKDVLALMDHLQVKRAYFCGLSIGGLVGQWLGVNAPDRIDKLVLCATAAKIGTAQAWLERAALVREKGLSPLTEGTVERWFNPNFVADCPERVQRILDEFLHTSAEGYAQCCEALSSADFTKELASISVPTLCLAGQEDPVCPPEDLVHIATQVQQGTASNLDGRHIFTIESAADFNAELISFLNTK